MTGGERVTIPDAVRMLQRPAEWASNAIERLRQSFADEDLTMRAARAVQWTYELSPAALERLGPYHPSLVVPIEIPQWVGPPRLQRIENHDVELDEEECAMLVASFATDDAASLWRTGDLRTPPLPPHGERATLTGLTLSRARLVQLGLLAPICAGLPAPGEIDLSTGPAPAMRAQPAEIEAWLRGTYTPGSLPHVARAVFPAARARFGATRRVSREAVEAAVAALQWKREPGRR